MLERTSQKVRHMPTLAVVFTSLLLISLSLSSSFRVAVTEVSLAWRANFDEGLIAAAAGLVSDSPPNSDAGFAGESGLAGLFCTASAAAACLGVPNKNDVVLLSAGTVPAAVPLGNLKHPGHPSVSSTLPHVIQPVSEL